MRLSRRQVDPRTSIAGTAAGAAVDAPILVVVGNDFAIALRGYDMGQVDHLLGRAEAALASNDRRRRAAVVEELRSAEFPLRLRGYDRNAVDRAVDGLLRDLA